MKRINAIPAKLHFDSERIHISDVFIEGTRFPARVDGSLYTALTLKYTETRNRCKQRVSLGRAGGRDVAASGWTDPR